MNERNPLQQLVDQNLSTLQWNEKRKRNVLSALTEERKPHPMKKKLSSAISLAVILCLLTGVALAATLIYSNRFTQAAQANALLGEQFGITTEMLSIFTRTTQGDIYLYESLEDLAGMPGDYRVNVTTGDVEWLFDGPEGSGWDAGKLKEILALCETPDGYKQVVSEAQKSAASLGWVSSVSISPSDTPAALSYHASLDKTARALASIPLEEAIVLAQKAIQLLRRNFDFTLRALHFTNTIQPKIQKTGLFMQTGLSSCMRYLQYSGIRWFLHLHPLGPILFPLCGHKPRRNSYHPAIWQPQSVRHSFPLPGVQSHVHRRPWP